MAMALALALKNSARQPGDGGGIDQLSEQRS